MPKQKKKNKKKHIRPRDIDPKNSDSRVLEKLDADRDRVQREVDRRRAKEARRFEQPYGEFDLNTSVATLMALAETARYRRQKRTLNERTKNEEK